jgi:hypothetical protein
MPAWRIEAETITSCSTGKLHRPDCRHAPDHPAYGTRSSAGSVVVADHMPNLCKTCPPERGAGRRTGFAVPRSHG